MSRRIKYLIISVFLLLFTLENAGAGRKIPIFPAPQQVIYKSRRGESFTIEKNISIVLKDGYTRQDLVGIQMFEDDIGFAFSYYEVSRFPQGKKAIFVGEEPLLKVLKKKGIIPKTVFWNMKKCPAEGYRISVRKNYILVIGTDPAGTFYGIQTLRQLILKDKAGQLRIPVVDIRDYPDFPLRGKIGPSYGNIKNMARQKFNYYFVYLPFTYGPLSREKTNETLEKTKRTFQLCREYHIEPIPIIATWTPGFYVLKIDPHCVEGIYVKDKKFIFQNDYALPAKLEAKEVVVKNSGFEQVSKNCFTYWGQDYIGEKTFDDTQIVREGLHSLRIESKEYGYVHVWQDVDCQPHRYYILECDIKGRGYACVYGLGVKSDTWGTPKIPPPIEGWEEYLAEPLGGNISSKGKEWKRYKSKPFYSSHYKRIRIFLITSGRGRSWFDNVKIKVADVKEPPGIVNLIITESSPLIVKSLDGNITYRENKDYQIIPGETKFGYSKNNKPWKVKRIPGGRIKNGDTVLISYNFAPPGKITCCPSEPRYYKIVKPLVQEVVSALHPKFLHICHDEPNSICGDSRCLSKGKSSGELVAEEVKKVYEYVKEVDPTCGLAMWSLDRWHAPPGTGLESLYDNIPKDILINAYVYQSDEVARRKMVSMLRYFSSRGFPVTGSPWYDYANNYYWAQAIDEARKRTDKCLGILSTNWSRPRGIGETGVAVAAEYGWSVNKPRKKVFEYAKEMYEYITSLGIPWMSPNKRDIEKVFRSKGKEKINELKQKAEKYVDRIKREYAPEFSELLDKHPVFRIGQVKKIIEFCQEILSSQNKGEEN